RCAGSPRWRLSSATRAGRRRAHRLGQPARARCRRSRIEAHAPVKRLSSEPPPGSRSPAVAITAIPSLTAIVPALHIDQGGSFVELLGPAPQLLTCCLGAATQLQLAHSAG